MTSTSGAGAAGDGVGAGDDALPFRISMQENSKELYTKTPLLIPFLFSGGNPIK